MDRLAKFSVVLRKIHDDAMQFGRTQQIAQWFWFILYQNFVIHSDERKSY